MVDLKVIPQSLEEMLLRMDKQHLELFGLRYLAVEHFNSSMMQLTVMVRVIKVGLSLMLHFLDKITLLLHILYMVVRAQLFQLSIQTQPTV